MERRMDNLSNSSYYHDGSQPPSTRGAIVWIALIYHSTIFVLGVPGNALIIRVYVQKAYKTSTHVLILFLAQVDIIVCFIRPFMLYFRYFDPPANAVAFRQIIRLIEFSAVGMSVFTTAVIAFDRYDAACNPHGRTMTPRKAKKILAVGMICSLILNALYEIEHLVENNYYLSAINNIMILVCYAICLILTTVFYTCVYKAVGRQARKIIPHRRSFDTAALHRTSTIVLPGAHAVQAVGRRREMHKIRAKEAAASVPNVEGAGNASSQMKYDTSDTAHYEKGKVILELKSSTSETNTSSERFTSRQSDSPPRAEIDANLTVDDHSCMRCLVSDDVRTGKQIQSQTTEARQDHLNSAPAMTTTRPSTTMTQFSIDNAYDRRFHSKVTRMLLIAAIIFFLTYFPYFFLSLISLIRLCSDDFKLAVIILKNSSMVNIFEMMYINNMINPWIYSAANVKFRQECKRIVSCR